jgi:hypothetical protein
MGSIWSGLRARRFFGTVLVFFVSSLVLVLLTNWLAAHGAKEFLDHLGETAKDALRDLSPQQLAVRFYVLQDPDPHRCGEFFSSLSSMRPRSTDCLDWLRSRTTVGGWLTTWLPARWTWAFIKLIGDIFAESPTKTTIHIVQLAAGSITALALSIWLDQTNWLPILRLGVGTIPALILTTLVCTTLLSLPILAIMFLGAKIIGQVVPTAELSLYGGSLSGLFYACSGQSLESGLHHTLGRTLERAIGRWIK